MRKKNRNTRDKKDIYLEIIKMFETDFSIKLSQMFAFFLIFQSKLWKSLRKAKLSTFLVQLAYFFNKLSKIYSLWITISKKWKGFYLMLLNILSIKIMFNVQIYL